jgi:predicted AAA+ superfamily ATPase
MSCLDRLYLQQREMQNKVQIPYIYRTITHPEDIGNLITVITGPRRAGKSTAALCQIIKGIPAAYINFDDEILASVTDFLILESALRQVYGDYKILMLDEIQNLPKWELIVNRLQRQGVRIVITGSNAHLLSSELATHLTAGIFLSGFFHSHLVNSWPQRQIQSLFHLNIQNFSINISRQADILR